MYPEGTTTNGTSMALFRSGVFLSGCPVQPLAIRFPHAHFNASWESVRTPYHLWRVFTQFHTPVEIVYLPVYYPSTSEKQCPALYARNVQQKYPRCLASHAQNKHSI
eukprot:1139349_1